jgi:hypothetical protein
MRKKFLLFLTVILVISSIISLFPSQIFGSPYVPEEFIPEGYIGTLEPGAGFVTITVEAENTKTPCTFTIVLKEFNPEGPGTIVYETYMHVFKYGGTLEELLSEKDLSEYYISINTEGSESQYNKENNTLTVTVESLLGSGRYYALVFAYEEIDGVEEKTGWDYAKFRVSAVGTAPISEPEKKPIIYYKNPDGFIRYMYRNILSRDPEDAGLNSWLGRLISREVTAADLVKSSMFGEECGAVFSQYSNEEFITFIYKVILWREPEESGFNTWLTLMNSGMTKEEIVDKFTHSEEFANLWKQFGVIPYPGYEDT